MNTRAPSKIILLSVVCACTLAFGTTSVLATDRPPARLQDSAVVHQMKASPLRKPLYLSSTQKQVGMSQSISANQGRGVEIARLKEQLARQETVLAAQQLRIARLEALFEQLAKQSARLTLLASYEPAPDPKVASAAHVQVGTNAAIHVQGRLRPLKNAPGALNDGQGGDPPVPADRLLAVAAAIPYPAYVRNLSPTPSTDSNASYPPPPSQALQEQPEAYTTRLDRLSQQVEGISKGVAGFRFSGSLRLRWDNIFRSAGSETAPAQRSRGQYRARLNLDKGISKQLDVHFQLASGRFDNPITDDTDFSGGAVRGPVFFTEAWADYHPNSTLSLRGGKMPEVFQDFTRFIWDEDVRFNGFQESVGTSPDSNSFGITRIDFRAGQYPLTDPNVPVLPSARQCTPAPQTITSLPATIIPPPALPATCAYLQAGYQPGEKVRASDLFDQGVFVKGRIKPGWSHYVFSNFMLFRNPNQIALTSTSAGLPLLVNPTPGVTLAGPLPGTGTATTIPGGGIYTASHFQIGRVAYRITKEGWKFRSEDFPVFLDVQASRNFGTSFLRNAWMATANAGDVKKAGDVRFLYFYAQKDANSMISQFTDDHAGTLTGVNIRTHAFRFDLGLARYLQWQNIFYIQNEISSNDPARHFYVTLPRSTPTQYRVESSLFVNF